jgi:DNA-binding LacI/PurR family transcriptional regulator
MASMTDASAAAKTIKLSDVAKAAGVSHGTASNVFSRPEIVREEVRERVHEAARKLGYGGPSPLGRMLRAGKVNAIGVATAEPLAYFFEDPFARVVLKGISDACDKRGAGISLVSAANNEQLAWNINSALVDGFINFCLEGGSRLVELTKERRLPFISLNYGFNEPDVPTIGIDDRHGARLAARHLVELGHRSFGVLSLQADENPTGPSSFGRLVTGLYSGTRDRISGYFDEIARAGIDVDTVPIYETENERETVFKGLDYLFERNPDITALLCMSDRMALDSIAWLQAKGRSVPGDVSIVGFDGVPESEISQPPLTTIVQPIEELGRRAANEVLDGAVSSSVLDVSLAIRGSTAAPRKKSLMIG